MTDHEGPSRRTVTMKDIAAAAGVSQSTVSRVLNGVEVGVPIAPATRRRVLDAARQFGYRPNPLARALRGSPTTLLGLIVREVADPFFAAVVQAITRAARREGYNLVLGDAGNSADEALTVTSVLETRHCDAILMLGDLKDAPALLAELRDIDVPLLGICQGERLRGVATVNVDNRLGAELALTYLHRLGHRHIAFLDGGWGGDIQERRRAFLAFMAERGLALPRAYHQSVSSDAAGGYGGCRALLGLTTPPTAIFAANDAMALGALKGAAEAGVAVPDDLSIIGFDDIPFARYATPSLTTVRQPIQQMADLTLQTALALISGAHLAPEAVPRLLPELIVRDSCRTESAGARVRGIHATWRRDDAKADGTDDRRPVAVCARTEAHDAPANPP